MLATSYLYYAFYTNKIAFTTYHDKIGLLLWVPDLLLAILKEVKNNIKHLILIDSSWKYACVERNHAHMTSCILAQLEVKVQINTVSKFVGLPVQKIVSTGKIFCLLSK